LDFSKKILLIICIIAALYAKNNAFAQGNGGPTPPSLTFELKTNPTADFTFSDIRQYLYGITRFNVLTLNVNAQEVNWDLYVGASTTIPGNWDNILYYGSMGTTVIPTTILQIKVNGGTNVDTTGFFPVPSISPPLPYYNIIGLFGNHAAIPCGHEAPNTPGSYITNPGCFKFNIDFRIVPGINQGYRPGQYYLTVEFFLVQDL
jgi:hypothetical protein